MALRFAFAQENFKIFAFASLSLQIFKSLSLSLRFRSRLFSEIYIPGDAASPILDALSFVKVAAFETKLEPNDNAFL